MPEMVNETRLGVLVGQKNYRRLRQLLADLNAVDVAHFIEALPEEQTVLVFRTLEKELAMDVFAELSPESQQFIIEAVSDKEISDIMNELAVDDAVDMLEELPAALVKKVLSVTGRETRELVNQFLLYPEGTAGSIMTAEFTDLKAGMTVEDAIKRLRRTGADKETIYTCYVMDEKRMLIGVVTVKGLLLSPDSALVGDIMQEDVISVNTADSQEDAAKLMAKYAFISLPVVDRENRLVGIVTIDDAVDVLKEETTEDFEKMAAMVPSEKPYLKSKIIHIARNRFLWLLVLMFSSMVTGTILDYYSAAFIMVPMLVTFIPMLTDTGGDAGSQSSTLVIRGLALEEIRSRDIGAVMWRELRVSVLVGIPLAAVNMARIALMYPGQLMVGLTVSLTMIATVTLANELGVLLPIFAKAVKLDPALMAAPLISTLVDATTLVLYFIAAGVLLGL